MKIKSSILLLPLMISLLSLQGCVPAVVAGAAAGGYIARDAGYKVQNPITKKEKAAAKQK